MLKKLFGRKTATVAETLAELDAQASRYLAACERTCDAWKRNEIKF